MSDENKKLNDYLKQVKKVNREIEATTDSREIAKENPAFLTQSVSEDEIQKERQGFFDRREMSKEKSKQELEKARTIFRTQLNLLKHRADAAERESANFWNAKSAEVAETIKTYVQSSMRAIENNRMQAKNEAFMDAYKYSKESLDKVCNSDLPEQFKEDLIQKIHDELESTIQRLSDESMAEGYKLK